MTQAALYQPPRASPTALGIVILLHGAAIGALALSKMDVIVAPRDPPTEVIDVPLKQIPEEVPPEPATPLPEQKITYVPPEVPIPPPPANDRTFTETETRYAEVGPSRPEPMAEPVRQPPIAIPVRREALFVSRGGLEPPYPTLEQRLGTEGSVTLRVLIGPDGRVRGAEKMRATTDGFYQATLRYALHNWRFKPATIDGRPIESSKVMTVHFKLNDDA